MNKTMIDPHHIALAQLLRDYNHINHAVEPVDCILVFGSMDLRVAHRGAELRLQGIAPYILFSGWLGRLTQGVREETEAEKFSNVALTFGVPEDAVLCEASSTNSSENVCFSMQLLEEKNISHDTLLIVHKPYMERRAYATFKKHFPQQHVIVTSQQVSMEEYVNESISLETLIHLPVGDTQRILLYPSKGFQIPQPMPDEVLDAMNTLISAWYTDYILY